MSGHRNTDIWGALLFSAALTIIVLVLFLTGCAQPGAVSSRVAAANPYCVWYCVVTQTSIEDNTGDNLTPTVGTAATGGSRTRTTTVEAPDYP